MFGGNFVMAVVPMCFVAGKTGFTYSMYSFVVVLVRTGFVFLV